MESPPKPQIYRQCFLTRGRGFSFVGSLKFNWGHFPTQLLFVLSNGTEWSTSIHPNVQARISVPNIKQSTADAHPDSPDLYRGYSFPIFSGYCLDQAHGWLHLVDSEPNFRWYQQNCPDRLDTWDLFLFLQSVRILTTVWVKLLALSMSSAMAKSFNDFTSGAGLVYCKLSCSYKVEPSDSSIPCSKVIRRGVWRLVTIITRKNKVRWYVSTFRGYLNESIVFVSLRTKGRRCTA